MQILLFVWEANPFADERACRSGKGFPSYNWLKASRWQRKALRISVWRPFPVAGIMKKEAF